MDAALRRFEAHFDEHAARGTTRPIWWRDDDARALSPAFDRLSLIARDAGAAVAVAAIPEGVTSELLSETHARGFHILQHGIGHHNAAAHGKKVELGGERTTDGILDDLQRVRERLAGPAFLPVLVPPWNRIRADVVACLPAASYKGLSLFGGSRHAGPVVRCDTHIDPIDWRGSRSLAGHAALCAMVEAAIAAEGPIGLLTHHLDHDEPLWRFVGAFAALVSGHRGALFVSAADVFSVEQTTGPAKHPADGAA